MIDGLSPPSLLFSPLWTGAMMLAAGLLAWLVARTVAQAGWRQLLDVPGERSSHQRPVPRGGGIGVVLACLAVLATLIGGGSWQTPGWPLLLALALVAAIGVVDDLRPLPAAARLPVHLLAGALLVLAIQPLVEVTGELTWTFALAVAIGVAWSVNLHNFMDGIDCLLTGQAVWCAVAFACLYLRADDPAMAGLALVLAAALLGFLPWNLPRARVFMGDGCAGFLGLMLAWLALYGGVRGWIGWAESLVIGSAFLIDSGATLIWRAVRGRPVWRAHRQHLYQYLVRAGASHGRVSGCYMLWNLFVAMPALILMRMQVLHPPWLIAVTVYLLGLALWVLLRTAAARRLAVREATL